MIKVVRRKTEVYYCNGKNVAYHRGEEMDEKEQRGRVIQFDVILEMYVSNLVEELLKDVDEEIIKEYYGEYTVFELIKNSLEKEQER